MIPHVNSTGNPTLKPETQWTNHPCLIPFAWSGRQMTQSAETAWPTALKVSQPATANVVELLHGGSKICVRLGQSRPDDTWWLLADSSNPSEPLQPTSSVLERDMHGAWARIYVPSKDSDGVYSVPAVWFLRMFSMHTYTSLVYHVPIARN